MTSGHPHFAEFYDDQVDAFRRVPGSNPLLDRLSGPTAIITVLLVLVAISFKIYDLDLSLDVIAHSTVTYLWDLLVFIVPTPLLVSLDNWLNKSSASASPPSTHAVKSEFMSRLLGLSRSSTMMESVIHAQSRARSVTGNFIGMRLDPERPPGLGNRDNSCYQNSILQGLASLPSFPGYLAACVRALDSQRPTNDVAHTLRALIGDLNDTSNNGRTIWTPSLLKSMSTWTQQDAQEYFSKILDDIDKSVARAVLSTRGRSGLECDAAKDDAASSEHSDDSGYQSLSSTAELAANKTLRNPLEGLLAQRVACIQCGFSEGLSMIPFNCLTLSLGLHQHQHDLFERLDAYSKVEAIEGVECPKCTLLKAQRLLTKLIQKFRENDSPSKQLEEPLRRLEAVELALEDDDFGEATITENCKITPQGKVTTTKTKQIVIARPPQSLTIHVNRSVFDPQTFDMIKNSAPVSFPQTLDLGPWCLGSAQDADEDPSNKSLRSSAEQWLLDPRSSMIAGDVNPSRLTGPIYELRAVVTHYGRHENGHYICYRKYPGCETPPCSSQTDDEEAPSSPMTLDREVDDVDDDDGLEQEPGDERKATQQVLAQESYAFNRGWWRLSDHNVTQVDEDLIKSLGPSVFMLFYECVDSGMVLHSDADSTTDVQEKASHTLDSVRTSENVEACGVDSIGCDVTGPFMMASGKGNRTTNSESDSSEPKTPDTDDADTLNEASSASDWILDEDEVYKPGETTP